MVPSAVLSAVLSVVLSAILAPAVGSLWEMVQSAVLSAVLSAILSEFGYLWNYDDNVGNLGQEVQMLENLKKELVRPPPECHEFIDTFQNWLNSVDCIIAEAMKFLEDEKNASKRCLCGLCPKLILRYQLGKQAKNTTDKIVRLKEQGRQFENKSLTEYSPSLAPKFKNEGYEEFKSRKSTLEEIKQALSDPSTDVIGIWGMPGIGKTMLVKEVANYCKGKQLFDNVVMAVVSKDPDIIKIQEQIADGLGLKLGREREKERAHQLRKKLMDEETNNLVILDNIWKKPNLEEVGIPLGGNSKKCKLVWTSTSREVLSDDMNAKTFEIGLLHENEAWDLFQKRAGHPANDPKLKDIATEVAKNCANLPLAIETIATALKNKKFPAIWRDALRQQTMSTPTKIPGINAEAYNSLKWCYEYSMKDNKDAESLLSLCCLFPEDHHISIQDILKHGKVLDLFRGIKTLEEERERVITLVDHLKGSSLLLDGYTAGFFRIHAVIRAVVISILVEPPKKDILFVRNNAEWEDLERNVLENCVAMSLPSIDICDLGKHGQGLQCPKLQLLLWLSKDQYSLEIPDTFFKGMERLKVLNLTNIVFSSLPSLSNLQTLCLEKCKLQDLSRIGELENLKKLSFRESDIEMLPTGIGQLTHLLLLDLSHCSNLKTIQSNVIARLTRLEELYMGNSFVKWEADGNARLVELEHLSRLVALEIGITDANILLPGESPFKEFKRYKTFVGGDHWDWSGDYETSKTLKLKLINTSILQQGINVLLGSTEVLYLDELNGASTVLYSLDREGFLRLKHLHVQSSGIEYVVKSEEQDPSCKAFPELESLFLFDLRKLTDIYNGQLPVGSFGKLRILKVQDCERLCKVLTMSVAGTLSQLQEFAVVECVQMEVIVGDNETDKITFPQLHSLKLKRLPVLVSFCAKVRTNIHSPNYAGEITPEGEPHIPIPFFNKKVAFQNLKLLNIECCDSLRNLFSPSMANDLVKLRAMKIINCRMMEEIVEKEKGVEEEAIDKIVFRLLSYITLQGLPELTSFYPGDKIFECPSLQKLTIDGCPRIKKFTSSSPLFDEKVVFPNLEFLMIENVNSLKEISSSQLPVDDDSFCKLKSLYLHCCEHLLNIVPSNMLMRLQNLTSLIVTTCQNLKHIFTTSFWKQPLLLVDKKVVEGIWEGDLITTIRYMFKHKVLQLQTLRLSGLSELKQICHDQFGIRACIVTDLVVEDCTSLLNVVSSNMLKSLRKLKTITVERCNSLEQVFDLERLNYEEKHDGLISNLEALTLIMFPKLRCIWKKDPEGILSFRNLRRLNIHKCDSLRNMFSPSMVPYLTGLEELIITDCLNMEEIIGKEKGAKGEAIDKIEFYLVYIVLQDLPNLKSFYPRNLTLTCPRLKTLKIAGCTPINEGCGNDDVPSAPFFIDEVAFPNLEELELSALDNMKETLQSRFHTPLPSKLRSLKVESCLQLKSLGPGIHVSEYSSLKKLEVSRCRRVQIFASEFASEFEQPLFLVGKIAFPNLEELQLSYLNMMEKIWQGQFHEQSISNLRVLKVEECTRISQVFPISSIQNLQKLEELSVENCAIVKYIVGVEREEEKIMDKMMLPQLTSLSLSGLRQLKSFCQGIPISEWTSLKKLMLSDCYNVKIFARELNKETGGTPVVPADQPLFLMDKVYQVAFPDLEELELNHLSKMKEIWGGQFHAQSSCKLRVLNVEKCYEISRVFPISLLQNLQNLEVLTVSNCSKLKVIFEHGGVFGEVGEASDEITFSQLKSLKLDNLAKLTSFCRGGNTLSFPSLVEVRIQSCPELKTFSDGILNTPKLKRDLNTSI